MSKTKIDTNVLAQIAQSLAVAAQALTNAISQPEVEAPKAANRGRPPKPKPLKPVRITKGDFPQNVVLEVEPEILEVINEAAPPPKPRSKEVFSPKAFGNKVGGVGVASASQDVTKNRGEMRFVDYRNVPSDNVTYPEPTDRRPPAQKISLQCSVCRVQWEAYPSEYPQALMKEKLPGSPIVDQPRVICENCLGR